MLGENCPVATPTTEDSTMSLVEQNGTPGENAAPVQPKSPVESHLSTESQQTPPTQEEAGEGDPSTEGGSGPDSDSESGDESESELESSAGPNAPSESSPDLPSRGNLAVVQGAQVNQRQCSQKPGTVLPSKGGQTVKKPAPTNSTKT